MTSHKFGRAAVFFVGLSVASALMSPGMAHAAEFPNLEERWGAGFFIGALNFGIAPTAEYWFDQKKGAAAWFNIVGDFTSYGVRGNYLLDKEMNWGTDTLKPYVSAGYAKVTIDQFELDGSGVEVYAGLQQFLPQWNPNVAVAAEFGFSTVKLEYDVPEYCPGFGPGCFDQNGNRIQQGSHKEDSGLYGGFNVGARLIYYFGGSTQAPSRGQKKKSTQSKTTAPAAKTASTCSRDCPNGNASATCPAGKSCGCSCSADGNAVCSCK